MPRTKCQVALRYESLYFSLQVINLQQFFSYLSPMTIPKLYAISFTVVHISQHFYLLTDKDVVSLKSLIQSSYISISVHTLVIPIIMILHINL